MENTLSKLLRESKNFAQSASNSVASNVSAPVDGLAWLLKKAGVPMPTNPMGGSDWMAEKGLTRPVNQNSLSGLLGEFAGLAGPMVAAGKAPQIAKGLLSLDDKAMDMGRVALEKHMVKNGMIQPMALFDTSGLPNAGRDLIQSNAESLADKLRVLGFNADVQHSGSVAGPSSYLKVFDPNTGRYFDNVRMSGHSKGPFNSAGVENVATPDEIAGVVERAVKMRELGPASGYQPQQNANALELLFSRSRPQTFNAFKSARDQGVEFSKYKAK